jgi:alkanesulfonate monooxygenase SsuD/methylene tetrahydromethanopterin reductase-like flavin-dependent oxidoreductase (luciferase family)
MKVGFILPGGTAAEQLELGVHAESCGWDGVFVWEAGYGIDAWSLLSAVAARTERVHLGTMLTPLPWRRPWKVASQASTLDQLAPGRTILALGLGALTEDLPRTGEVEDLRERAALLDDGIDLMRALWSGASAYEGPRFRYSFEVDDQLRVARPPNGSIPIWVVAAWPRPKSMGRALRCEGVVPQYEHHDGTPEAAQAARVWLRAHGARADIDLIAQGQTTAGDRGVAEVARWEAAGCTWWLETNWEMPHHAPIRMQEVKERLTAGPPRPSNRAP